MKVIGLTGPSGSGKGCCDEFFRKHGIPCLDTDQIYHDLLIPPSPCANELVENFGETILNPDGSINRSQLSSIVFEEKSGSAVKTLNQITHKYVSIETLSLIEQYRAQKIPTVVIDAPLLFEANFDRFCDFCIAVLAQKEIRLRRITERDHITKEKAMARIKAQPEDAFYLNKAKHTVYNNNGLQTLFHELHLILISENVSIDTQSSEYRSKKNGGNHGK